MDSLARFFKKLGMFFRREEFINDLDEEMAFHREQKETDLRAEGMSPQTAHHAAARQFGNTTVLKEQTHETVAFWFETTLQDLLYALRQLRRNLSFTLTAVLMLALGIGASAAIFAFVDAALIRPLPYPDPATLVDVGESAQLFPRSNLSYQDYLDWKRLNKVFSAFDVYTNNAYLLASPSGAEHVHGAHVTAGFFGTLGVAPILGRDFTTGEDQPGAPNTVILSYETWQKRFAGRKDIIGQSVTLSGTPNTIIGVLPQTFTFAPIGQPEFWVTFHTLGGCEKRRSCHNLFGIGRLKPGVSVAMALADMQSIALQLERQYPDSNRGQGAFVQPLHELIVGDIRPILLTLFTGAVLLLLIACVNVSSLLLVRAESRRREVAVRGALGASPSRLARQFITEGLVLVAAGTLLGLATSYAAIQILLHLISQDMLRYMPFLIGLTLNLHIITFVALVALLAAAIFSLTPIVRLSFSDMRSGLAEGGRTSAGTLWRRFGANLVVFELAIAVVLLVGAGLLVKSFYRLLNVDLNFQPDHLATLCIDAPDASYSKDTQAIALGRSIIHSITALPGVKSAAITSVLPVSYNGNTDWIRFPGRPYNGQHNEVNEREVSSAFFTTLQARLIRGRFFTDDEDISKPKVVLINQALAKKYFPGEDPIGKQIGDTDLTSKSLKQIIGVVDDVKEGSLDSEIWPAEYIPFNQNTGTYYYLIARTSQAPESILPTLTSTIHHIDPGIGTLYELTMAERIADSQTAWLHRSSAVLVGGFAALAFLLGVVGLYGVIAYSVSRRTREIGVRMALGAQRSTVYRLILKEAGWLTAFGIVAGVLCSLAATALMHKLLFGVHSWDVTTLIAVALVLAISALLASYIPARRAASVNPVEALRAE